MAGDRRGREAALRVLAENAVLAVAIGVAGWLSQRLRGLDDVSLVWAPAGIALAMVLVRGYRVLPGVALGSAALWLGATSNPALAALRIAGEVAGPVLARLLLRRWVSAPRQLLESPRGVLALLGLGACVPAMLGGSLGSVGLLVSGSLGRGAWFGHWLWDVLGHALGAALVAPVLIAWHVLARRRYRVGQALELAVFVVLILGIQATVYGGRSFGLGSAHLEAFLVVPLLLGMALRFSLLEVSTVNALISVVAAAGVAAGLGPMAAFGARVSLEVLHGYVLVVTATVLMLGSAASRRRGVLEVLREDESRLHSLTRVSSDWYWELDADLRYTRMTAYGAEARPNRLLQAAVGRVPWDLSPLEAVSPDPRQLRIGLEARRPFRDFLMRYPDGRGGWHYVRFSGEPLSDARGQFTGYRGVAKHVSEELRAQENVRVREAMLRRLIDGSPDMIVLKDAEGRWQMANQALLDLWRLEGAAWTGRTDGEIARLVPFAAGMLARAADATRRVVATGKARSREELMPHAEHAARAYDVVATPIFGPEGRVSAVLHVAQDISRLKKSEEVQLHQLAEIQRLNTDLETRVQVRTAALEAANRELAGFSYSVSHDLRAPLRALDGFSSMLEEDCAERLDERGLDYIARIRRASRRMGVLIDELLKLSRISQSEVRREDVDLGALAAGILRELQEMDPARQVTVEIAPDLHVEADPGLVRVLLENLLRNAWKFSRGAAPARIEVGVEGRDGRRMFFVRDNGVGFDATRAERLFAPFQRLHTEAEFEGTGIGLAIVQRVVRLHGGQVAAQSAVGAGATFYFELG
ncbi:MAG: PAS domain-containing protein [Betaproteobacteria bacterium]|nr:PAS domain-containing protein [Betaproteobacteria bacterium]